MSSMFESCFSLEEVDISNFNTKNVTNISGMFRDTNNLKKVYYSSIDFSNATNIKSLFLYSNINYFDSSEINLGENGKNLDTSELLQNVNNLKYVDFSAFAKIDSDALAYENCLSVINLNSKYYDASSSIGGSSFNYYNIDKNIFVIYCIDFTGFR